MTEVAFRGWAILEVMGHRTRPGFIREVEMAGGKMLRVDIPVSETDHVTEYYGAASIYSLRPATEELVRQAIKDSYQGDPRPVRPLDYREPPAIESRREEDRDESVF